MTTMEFMAGTHINEAAAALCAAATDGGSVEGSFNGVRLVANRTSTPAEIVATFNRMLSERAEAYRNSPEGRASAERADAERRAKQAKHDMLMEQLPAAVRGSRVAILDWLCDMQEPSDHVGVIVRKDTILAMFAKHLYEPGMDCGPDYRRGSKNSEFRYLVGQALDGLAKVGAIHPILHKFVAEWKERWPEEQA